MRKRFASLAVATVLAAALLAGCGKSNAASSLGDAPTKETLVKTLETLATALESGDMDTALGFMKAPEGIPADKLKVMLPALVEKHEISAAGVKVLAAKGKFGSLAEVFPDKGPSRAERVKVKAEECYALAFEAGEVMAHWDGRGFKIFRLDDVGKLAK